MKASPWLLAGLSTLLSLTASIAQEVVDLSLYRAGFYEQLSDAEPQPVPETPDESPFYFLAVMAMSEEFLSDPDNLIFVRGATLQPPSGSLRALDFLDMFGGFVDFRTYRSAEALQAANRDGTYTFTFSSVLTGDSEFGLFVPEAMIPQPARGSISPPPNRSIRSRTLSCLLPRIPRPWAECGWKSSARPTASRSTIQDPWPEFSRH